jgi:mRNA-degrading endonuclease toxin of MazEF toxin-antitoxin module
MARAADLTRGDIWDVDFGPEIGQHPAVLIGRTGAMRRRQRAIVALITSEATGLPTEVPVGPEHGLKGDSVVDAEDLYTFAPAEITHFVGRLDSRALTALDVALRLALDLRS